jgi:hypothetical protein
LIIKILMQGMTNPGYQVTMVPVKFIMVPSIFKRNYLYFVFTLTFFYLSLQIQNAHFRQWTIWIPIYLISGHLWYALW